MELKILLIDDMTTVKDDVENSLRRIGVSADVVFISPSRAAEPDLGLLLPVRGEWNDYAYCLLDLELAHRADAHGLQGGEVVLPRIREAAPWLPVLSLSRLLTENSKHLLALASGFGFDGLVPKSLLAFQGGQHSNNQFNAELWRALVTNAEQLRFRSVLGDGYTQRACDGVSVAICDALRDEESWLAPLVRRVFWFARKVVLEGMTAGYSGASVIRATVTHPAEAGAPSTSWVVKTSANKWKLQREAVQHQMMMRSVMGFGEAVQLLWPGVVSGGSHGALVYQYANGTQSLADGPPTLTTALLSVQKRYLVDALTAFYGDWRVETELCRKVLRQSGLTDGLDAVRAQLPNSAARLVDDVTGAGASHIDRGLRYARARIHGDLHLGNVLADLRRVVFIDFAKAMDGPVVQDVAQLLVDSVVRRTLPRPKRIEDFLTMPIVRSLTRRMKLRVDVPSGDRVLFILFLFLFSCRYVGYSQSDEDTKQWLCELISDFDISAVLSAFPTTS